MDEKDNEKGFCAMTVSLLPICITIFLGLLPTVRCADAASIDVYSDRTSFLAAAGTVTTLPFNKDVADSKTINVAGNIPVYSTTKAKGYSNNVSNGMFNGFVYDEDVEFGIQNDIDIVWKFAMDISAWGGDFVISSWYGYFTASSPEGDIYVELEMGSDGFFGLVSDTKFNEIWWSSEVMGGDDNAVTFSIDNFHYKPHAVPEPATMLLMGAGLAGLIGACRKKKA